MKIGIVISRYNEEITQGLIQGAKKYLERKGIALKSNDIYYAPGAFELPLIAQELARTNKYHGIIALGCIVKGSTAHFEFVSMGATIGITQAMLQTRTPIAFGILTTYNQDQAKERSLDNAFNKGREAAIACIDSIEQLGRIRSLISAPDDLQRLAESEITSTHSKLSATGDIPSSESASSIFKKNETTEKSLAREFKRQTEVDPIDHLPTPGKLKSKRS